MGKTHNGGGMRYLFWREQATLRVYVGQIGQRKCSRWDDKFIYRLDKILL